MGSNHAKPYCFMTFKSKKHLQQCFSLQYLILVWRDAWYYLFLKVPSP